MTRLGRIRTRNSIRLPAQGLCFFVKSSWGAHHLHWTRIEKEWLPKRGDARALLVCTFRVTRQLGAEAGVVPLLSSVGAYFSVYSLPFCFLPRRQRLILHHRDEAKTRESLSLHGGGKEEMETKIRNPLTAACCVPE